MTRVQLPLRVTGYYLLLVGLVSLFPGLANTVFRVTVGDPALALIYGGILIGVGYLVWKIGSEPGFAPLAPVVVLLQALHVLTFVVVYARGQWGLQTVAVPIVINVVLGFWIWSASRRAA